MKKLVALIMLACICFESYSQWLSGYNYRRKITIDAASVAGTSDLNDFPYLIATTDADYIGKVRSDGYDVAITTDDGTTQLDFEIELYDNSTGQYIIWVRIPSLSPTTNTILYMYFGNSSITSDPSKTTTWDENHCGVWHLSGSNLIDATSNANDGILGSAVTVDGAGYIGSCYRFSYNHTDGITSNDASHCYAKTTNDNSSSSLRITGPITISAWVKRTGEQTSHGKLCWFGHNSSDGTNGIPWGNYGIEMQGSSDEYLNFVLSASQKKYYIDTEGNSSTIYESDPWTQETKSGGASKSLIDGQWMHVAATYDNAVMRVFIDGTLASQTASVPSPIGDYSDSHFLNNVDWGLILGNRHEDLNDPEQPFSGYIDEVRISNTMRSEHWINTFYSTMADPSITVHQTTFTWTGNSSTDWETNTNWSGDVVPSSGDDIRIPNGLTNYPVIGADKTIGNLEIVSGASCDFGTYNVTINESIKNDGTVESAGSVTFDGTNPYASIYGAGSFRFNHVNIQCPVICDADIGVEKKLLLNNAFTLNGDLTLYKTSSLMDNGNLTVTGSIKVSLTLSGQDYHYISSPLSAVPTSTFSTDPWGFSNPNFYYYDENTPGDWMLGWKTPVETNMTIGKGYAIYHTSNVTYNMSGGTINTGTNDFTINHSASAGASKGWNLIGNPYPSIVYADDFVTLNTSISGTLYFWEDASNDGTYTTSDYASWNKSGSTSGTGGSKTPNDYIALGQAFFVESTVPTSTIVRFTDAMRNSEDAVFFKASTLIERFKLAMIGDNEEYNETLISFTDDATDGYDRLYDGKKLIGNPDFALYSLLDEEKFAIQAFPKLKWNDSRIVPIGLQTSDFGTFHFKVIDVENISENVQIYLEDKQQNRFINLKKHDIHCFQSQAGNIHNRFFLHFSRIATSEQVNTNQNFANVYAYKKKIFIELPTESYAHTEVRIYDITGKMICNKKLQSCNDNCISCEPYSGIFIVKLLNKPNQKISVHKLFIE